MRRLVFCLLLSCFLTACGPADRDVLYQASTLQALMVGVYDGPWTVGEIRRHGDLGLGTFNGLDGEMAMLDGVIYQVSIDGKVTAMPDSAGAPFVNVTHFEADATHELPAGMDMEAFQKWMDARLPSLNLPYAFRVDGTFRFIRTRSVPRQHEPYPPLTEAVKQQRTFEFHDVKGTVLGFRFPDYLKGVNVSGYHLHFLTADRTGGGHLLAFTVSEATAATDTTPRLVIDLPRTSAFMAADAKTTADDVHAVEKGR
jgi:acetolactate decarboxylase